MNSIKEHKKKLNKKANKPKLLLISLVLLLTFTVGSTIAFLVDKEEAITNTFTASKVDITVDEDLDGDVKSNVVIQNTGDTEAYIRAMVVITWQDKDGNVFGTAPKKDVNYTLAPGSEKWIKSTTDGFYYYTLPVAASTSTENLITMLKPVADTTPEGYSLNVEILASAIQSVPTSVITTEWSSGVSGIAEDGTTLVIK